MEMEHGERKRSADRSNGKRRDYDWSHVKREKKSDASRAKKASEKNADKTPANQPKQPKSIKKASKPLICPLCGKKLQRGQMDNHKVSEHGEKRKKRTREVSLSFGGKPVELNHGWVHFVQGGSPGSGKRK
jgi:hypothetical protein